jgi:hypothetical protein
MAIVLGNISFAYPIDEHQPADLKLSLQHQKWRKDGKVEGEQLSKMAEDISKTFLVIFETLPDTPRVSRKILVNNVTKSKSEGMAGILWAKSHVIEEVSKIDVKKRTNGKRGSEVNDVPRPDHTFVDKIKDTKSKNKTNLVVNQNRATDKVSMKIKIANSNASIEKEMSSNGLFKMIQRRNNKMSEDNIKRVGQTPGGPTNTNSKLRWGTWGKGFVNIATQSFGGGKGKKKDFVH